MKRYRKEIQTKLLKYGGLYEIVKKNGFKIILDIAVSKVLSIYIYDFIGLTTRIMAYLKLFLIPKVSIDGADTRM